MTVLKQSAYLRQAQSFSRNARLFLVSQMLAGLGSGIFSLLFNLYLVRSGYHEDFIGQVAAVSTLALGAAALPAGLLADRIGRRLSLAVGGTVGTLGYLGQALAPTPQAILVCGALGGTGLALLSISLSPFMAENSSPEERPYLFSLSYAFVTLLGMAGNLIGGVLPRVCAALLVVPVYDPAPYRLALIGGMAMYVASCVPLYLLREDPHVVERLEEVSSRISMDRADVRRRMAVFAVANIVIGMGGGLVLPFFNVYFSKTFGLPAEGVGIIFAVSQALMGMGMLLSPAMVRRTGKVPAIVGGHFCVAPFLAILALTNSAWVAAAAFWGRNVSINAINPVYSAFAMEMVPARLRATLSGINLMAWNGAWAASSAVAGMLILSLGYDVVFVMSAVLYAITGSIYAVAFRGQWRAR